MTKKFMCELKKEVQVIERSIRESRCFPYDELKPWLSYMVVMRDQTRFYLNSMSTNFPDINYDDIVLITKRDCSYCEDEEKFYDSEVGQYISDFPEMYKLKISKTVMTGEED